MKLLGSAILALLISCVGVSAQAATYTLDYNEGSYTYSANGTFTTDVFTAIDSASLDFLIAGRTYSANSSMSWVYDCTIDLFVGTAKLLDNYALGGDWTTLHFDLGEEALSLILAGQSLSFVIQGQDGWYYRSDGGSGYSRSRFYLDTVTLNVAASEAPSEVPLPAAVVLFASGLAGLAGVAKRKKA